MNAFQKHWYKQVMNKLDLKGGSEYNG